MKIRHASVVSATLVVALVGVAAPATAQSADDLQILLDNLPAASEELVAGAQDAVDTLVATTSVEETSHALGDGVVAAGTVLVTGTEQFGSLGFGFSIIENVAQGVLAPYLQAIDDPSTASELVDPTDLQTIADNLAPTLELVEPYAVSATVEALRGNLVHNGLLGTPAVVGDGINAIAFSTELFRDTNYESLTGVAFAALIVGAVAGGSVPLEDIEAAVAPIFDAAAPATEPLIAIIEGGL